MAIVQSRRLYHGKKELENPITVLSYGAQLTQLEEDSQAWVGIEVIQFLFPQACVARVRTTNQTTPPPKLLSGVVSPKRNISTAYQDI